MRFYILLFGFFSLQVLSAQSNVYFKKLLKKDGLSQSSVFSVAQDSSGFIWLGTRDGLNKYDGYGFTTFKKSQEENSIISNDVRCLFYDHSHNLLWIGTNAGLSSYQMVTHVFTNYQHSSSDSTSISSNIIRQIYRDKEDRLWIATALGLNLMDESNKAFVTIHADDVTDQSAKLDINVISESSNGQLLVGTTAGLYTIESKSSEASRLRMRSTLASRLGTVHIQCLLEDVDGHLWVGTKEQGLMQWHSDSGALLVYKQDDSDEGSISHDNIRDVCLDGNGNLWVGTFNGLNLLKQGTTKFTRYSKSINESNGLSDKSIRSLFQDMQGSLWIGTYYGGVNILDRNFMPTGQDFTPISNNLKGNVVSSFAETDDGHLWVGTEGNGLQYLDKNGLQIKNRLTSQINKTLSITNVKGIFLEDDNLWVGTFQKGLYNFDLKTGNHLLYTDDDPNSISADNVYGILKESNRLWLLSYGAGLDIYDLYTSKFYNYSSDKEEDTALSSNLTRCILKSAKGQIWVGTESGLNKVVLSADGLPQSFITYISHEKIYCLSEDHNHNVWIGTFDNGLYRLDQNTNIFHHYTSADGLPSNTILGIMESNNRELWVSTNDGLAVFNPDQKTFSQYSHPSTVDNSEYNYNAYYKTRDGKILFGGVNGFTQFSPELLSRNVYVPPIVLTGLKRNNQHVQVGDESKILSSDIDKTESITFDYDKANFSITFAALDYFSPENNHYATYMEGVDKDWNYSIGATEATYTLQREGTYLLKIKGGNNEGVYNPEIRTLEIKVKPPVWRTWWAYLLYFLMTVLVLTTVIRYLRLKSKLQLEKITNLQQEELHEVKMRFFTNITHEFRTPLTLIVAPVNDLLSNYDLPETVMTKLKSMNRNAGRLLNLTNQILSFRKLDKDHVSLKIIKGNFNEFLKEIFLMFSETATRRNITYDFTELEEVPLYYDQDKLEKVFYNLLSNAFKFTPDGGHIRLTVTPLATQVEVRVQDSGIGIKPEQQEQIFKRFYEKSDNAISRIKGTGIGLELSKQMVELHHGSLVLEKSNTQLSGANFLVSLPLGHTHFEEVDIIEDVVTQLDEIELREQNMRGSKNNLAALAEINTNDASLGTDSKDDLESHMMIVEDNDEVRELLAELFKPNYKITTATNGAEALELINETPPDLIISDVMMPIMDGITFCNKLKNNLETSHIPLLLLTARTASLFRIDGLKNGADDYITKPFLPQELQLKVRNILRSKKESREKFMRLMNFDPKEVQLPSQDELFLERAIKIVDENMDNTAFNVNQFASLLTVSRPLLFTKIKALTGQTPNNFVKTIRLKRAAQLIKTEKYKISEVAYNVGFNDTKYFGKCFKEQFGTSPTKYMELEPTE